MSQWNTCKTLIVIPARFHSQRFPGKPLVSIAGKSMLERVHKIAVTASSGFKNTQVVIATEDHRIVKHAQSFGATAILTPTDCATGSDRALSACHQLKVRPNAIVNLQGDAPLTPPSYIRALLSMLSTLSTPHHTETVVTPAVQLSWSALEEFRQFKQHSPFSGTTVVINQAHEALWFSKGIIPAIRHENSLRQSQDLSPIYRHIGLYGYTLKALERFVALPKSHYEQLEGLEQLRLLENGIPLKVVKVEPSRYPNLSGVDTPNDAQVAEQMILTYGEQAS